MTTKLNCNVSMLSIFIFCLLIIPPSATAQSTGQSFTVSLTGGLSLPVGRFANDEVVNSLTGNDKEGAAKMGWLGNLQVGYQFNRHLGLAITGGFGQYKQNEEAYIKHYEAIYGNTAIVETKKWNVLRVLAGPTFTAGMGGNLSFHSGIAAGIAKTAIPGLTFMVLNAGGNPMVAGTYSKTKVPTAFAYQLNAGIGFGLSKVCTLLLDLNYFDATVKYKYTPLIISPAPTPTPTATVANKYKLGAFSALLGIGFSF